MIHHVIFSINDDVSKLFPKKRKVENVERTRVNLDIYPPVNSDRLCQIGVGR
jgi:hypothetical protein